MKLYLRSDGGWAGTQAEAGKKGTYKQVDVPTDKPGLLNWLNTSYTAPEQSARERGRARTLQDECEPKPKKPTIQEQRERLFETMVQVEEYIHDADYNEARRVQSLAVERLAEHIADMRSKKNG